jgi:hypothetical protein
VVSRTKVELTGEKAAKLALTNHQPRSDPLPQFSVVAASHEIVVDLYILIKTPESHDFSIKFPLQSVSRLAIMSGRLLQARLLPLAQRANINTARSFHHHTSPSAGGLLRSDAAVRAARRRIWPAGYTPFSNAVAVRNVSFVRILPRLLLKFARIPALFGGATIAGLAYVQYQAARTCFSGWMTDSYTDG